MSFIISPIEQFNLIPVGILCSGLSNLSFFFIFIIICLFLNYSFINKSLNFYNYNFNIFFYLFNKFYLIYNKQNIIISIFNNMINFIPTKLQYIFEVFSFEFINMFKNLVNKDNLIIYFYSVYTSIIFILFSNIIGLIPFTFTLTAQIFLTFNLSIFLFLSFNMMGFNIHSFELVNIIIPAGVHVSLHFLLMPIELISYIFRPISLSIRLFANIMAGHTLLKVICGFIYKFFEIGLNILISLIPFSIITTLFGLETFVALIQSYVFFILLSLFLKDILSLSH